MSKIKYIFCIAAIGAMCVLYQNCSGTDSVGRKTNYKVFSSDLYEATVSNSCTEKNNSTVVSFSRKVGDKLVSIDSFLQDFADDISFRCKQADDHDFVNCSDYDLETGSISVSTDGNVVFTGLEEGTHSFEVEIVSTSAGEPQKDTININCEGCVAVAAQTETTSTTGTTSSTATTSCCEKYNPNFTSAREKHPACAPRKGIHVDSCGTCCVECRGDGHCSGDTPRCDGDDYNRTYTCVECKRDNNCLGKVGTPYCNGRKCVACTNDAHCPGPCNKCDKETWTCVKPCLEQIEDSKCQTCDGVGICESPRIKTCEEYNPNFTTPICRAPREKSTLICEDFETNKVCCIGCSIDHHCPGACNKCNEKTWTCNGGKTCDQKRNSDPCKVCDIPNSCDESPRDKRCASGQVCENGICITPPECDSDSDCSGPCNRCNDGICSNQQVSCTANPATCTTCPNGKCGRPQTGKTCSSQITDPACQECSNPNSCTEKPTNKITCGSGGMTAYPLSTRPVCPTGEHTLCGKTCYREGATCSDRIISTNCQTCDGVGICRAPRGKTCEEINSSYRTEKTLCGASMVTLGCGEDFAPKNCYRGGSVCDGNTPHCKDGKCVACTNDAHCPGVCNKCNRATWTCNEGQTCTNKITDSTCQECPNPNSCTEPSSKNITCGSGDMTDYPLSSEPACPTGEHTLCDKTCHSGTGATCTANPATCTTCPSGVCGQPRRSKTCDQKRNSDPCKVCSNPNSCDESPRDKTITCGSRGMAAYPLSTRPACPTGETTSCGQTCYTRGTQTCDQKRNSDPCKVCSDPNSCTEQPRDKTITCGSGDMVGYPLSSEPACPTGNNTVCDTICYARGTQTCGEKKGSDECQICAAPNSCTENPRQIRCGEGIMIDYPHSTKPSGLDDSRIGSFKRACNITCYQEPPTGGTIDPSAE